MASWAVVLFPQEVAAYLGVHQDKYPGWTSDTYLRFVVVVTAPGHLGGMVTIDPELRAFELGAVTIRQRGPYKGRDWKLRLIEDALTKLKEIIQPKQTHA